MSGACIDCGTPTSRYSTGRCRPCATKVTWSTPEFQAKRLAALRVAVRTPEARAAKSEARLKLEAERADDPDWIAYKRKAGQRVRRQYDADPEAQARNLAKRASVGAQIREQRLAWCPSELRDDYYRMRRKVGAEAAREAIEAEIPGTAAHARQQVANAVLKQRLRHEREQAQAY